MNDLPNEETGASLSVVKDDKHFSRAFSALEIAVEDMNGALAMLELAAEKTVFNAESFIAKDIKKKYEGLDQFTIHVFTDAQIDGLVHALYHAMHVCQKLRDEYRGAVQIT